MAIARDNTKNIQNESSGLVFTESFTTAGSDRALFVGFTTGTADDVVTVTYNLAAMTQAQKIQMAGTNRWSYVYYLLNPAVGTNNIVWTFAGSQDIVFGGAVSYTGVNQSAIDGSQTDSVGSGTTLTNSQTTTSDNCWVTAHYYTRGANITASTGATFVATSSDNIATSDSNGAITPAGVNNQVVTWTNSQEARSLSIGFAPSAAATANHFLSVLGVGT